MAAPDILSLLKSPKVVALIALLWAAAYLPMLGARDLRQEEGRRATPAREMLATGDYLTPRLYGEPYLSKPPGFFWVIAGIGTVQGGVTPLTGRLASAVAMLIGALVMLALAPRELPRSTRALAALMLLSTAVLLDKGTLGEIDSLMCALSFAILVTFYNAYRATYPDNGEPPRPTLGHWLLIGALGGIVVLLKGPGGPLQIVPPIVVLLLWERRPLFLLRPGPILAALLAAAPIAVWLYLLQSKWHFPLGVIYSDQLGVDVAKKVAGGARAGVDEEGHSYLTRYLQHFPYQMLTMPLPWVIWAIPAMVWRKNLITSPTEPRLERRGLTTPQKSDPTPTDAPPIPRPLWRFLICASVIMIIPFYLWPAALGRHVMTMVYAVCVLAAAWVTRDAARPASDRLRRMTLTAATLFAAAPMACGVMAVGLAIQVAPRSQGIAWVLAIGGAALSAFLTAVVRRTRKAPAWAGAAFAVVLAVAVLSGRALASGVLIPWKAATDDTRLVRRELQPLTAGRTPLYTMEYFKHDTPGSFYNIQFYAGGAEGVRALKSINDLPAGKAVTVIGTEADRKTLVDAGVRVEDVGDTRGAEGKKKEVARLRLYVFTATREKAAPAVGRPLNE